MRAKILNQNEWWDLEGKLNKSIPGEEELPDFDQEQNDAECSIRAILQLRGEEDEAWEVPEHYHRCAVIYSYIYDDNLLGENLFKEVMKLIPDSKYDWYVQFECYSSAGEMIGDVIIYDDTCYCMVEDPIIDVLSSYLGVSWIRAKFLKLKSKFICRKHHAEVASKVRSSTQNLLV